MPNFTSPASEAIALLIDLAQRGEIDPWDVQVIEVIDRFLAELGLQDRANNFQEADLSQSGQVLLWASMLVLLKANTLEKIEAGEEEVEAEIAGCEGLSESRQNPLKYQDLEQQIRRRAAAPAPKRRKVTLSELIAQLEEIAAEVESGRPAKSTSSYKPRPYSQREALKTIMSLAHNENLVELALTLDRFLQQEVSWLFSRQDAIDLEELIDCWSSHYQEKTRDRVGLFWALLILSSQSKVELTQKEFYQDLQISLL